MIRSLTAEANRRRTAIYSFCGAVVVSLLFLGTWLFVRTRPGPATAMQRRLTETTVLWRCPEQHVFAERGTTRRLPCPQCNHAADILVKYACSVHGEKPALVRMTRDAAGNAQVSEVSHHLGVWDPVDDGVPCPQCKRYMTSGAPDPFEKR